MKNTRKLIASILMSLILLVGIPGYAQEQNIVEIAAGSEDFSILVAAVQKAELAEALQGEGPFTVFAPTNAAFEKLLAELSITAEDLLNHPQLADVLLYHVVAGKVLSTDLQNGMTAETLGSQTIAVDLSMGVKINSSAVTTADILATNGVIHVIDTVLVPETFQPAAVPEGDPALGYVDLSPMKAKELIDSTPDLVIIDVSPMYDKGHIPGAINYYIGDGSLDEAIPTLDKAKTYLVYCHTDSASIGGATKLIEAGFEKVFRLEGNFSAWVDAGYPVE